MAVKSIYNTKRWHELRRQVILEEPVCHWCRKALSTQADHIIETDRGGEAFARDNLVGSCKPCNSKRGAKYVNDKHGGTPITRPQAGKARKTAPPRPAREVSAFLGQGLNHPERPLQSSLRNASDLPTQARISPSEPIYGHTRPRLATPLVGVSGSLGSEVVEWASRVAGVELLPWQVTLFEELLALGDDGRLRWFEAMASTARQNGKSLSLRMLAGWWATGMAVKRGVAQHVLIASNRLERSMAIFAELGPLLEEKFGATYRRGNNSPLITMPDGSTIMPIAATVNKHGLTADLILLDEVWDIEKEVMVGALRPAMRTRKESMLVAWSTAGEAGSHLMRDMRTKGIKGIETGDPGRFYLAEWSPPEGSDPDDPACLAWANPSLGHMIDVERLLEDAEDRNSFVRTALNMWVEAHQSWLHYGAWDRQKTDRPMPAGGILAVEKARDEPRYVGLRAVPTEDGCQVQTEFIVTSEAQMVREIERVLADRTVMLRMPPGMEMLVKPELRRRNATVGIREIRKYTTHVAAQIIEGKVWHDGDAALAAHVNRAVAIDREGAWYVVESRSPGPVELCRCLIWAAAEANQPKVTQRPAFAGSNMRTA